MLSSIAAGLLVIYLLVVPFRRWEISIDRRSGIWSSTVIWCGIVRTPGVIANGNWSDPAIPASFTAEVREIAIGQRFQRFPWSRPSELQPEPGAWYGEAFLQMFSAIQWQHPRLTDEERRELINARIPRWNSMELDRDPHAVAEEMRQENQRIFAPDYPYLVIPR